MINLSQEKEIEQYLLSKKLSQNLAFEIKDHFIQQISTQMEETNISFPIAFRQAQQSWKHELEMIKADGFSFKKIARIEKTILQRRFWKITLYALIFSLILLISTIISPSLFMYLQILLLGIIITLVIYNIASGRMKWYNCIQLSFHPLVLKNALIGAIIFATVFAFYNDVSLVGNCLMKFFFLYAISSKIQLLYTNAKKVSVLI